MRKLLGIVSVAAVALVAWQAAAPALQVKAADMPRAAFIKKCLRDMTKESCTAPADARASR